MVVTMYKRALSTSLKHLTTNNRLVTNNTKKMYFIFDTETTGLPIFNKTGFYRFPNYKHLNKYNPSRVVSISWILANEKREKIKQAYHIIRPLDFTIDNSSKAVEIHGITSEIAEEQGVPWHTMYDEFIEDVSKCHTIIAHNIQFDVSVMLSEMYRYNQELGISTFIEKSRLCTMKMGKTAMNQTKSPKLSELYEHLYNEPLENAHDASFDTLYCYKCFAKMMETSDNDTVK
jgi:DNA polymerase III subunit alpha